ncbi:Vam6/Vps39-like protein [Operophtera brumata]|uniref:Vam6/Vps39-like protein n=1 Tax=Operophtera brumata TaxID=104452 RepID=A0A0L7L086_OPEBR|nr:Vam6/Vps39-like protein [Operophtera brumata]
MHEAYEVSHLLNGAVQIESIAAFDNNLLLGTRQGHLLMYSLSTGNDNNQKYEVQILHYCKTFSKKPIQQIEVIPEDNLLLCLTDSILSTHSLNGSNFPVVKTFEQTKGASLFALDNKLYYGKNGEFKQHLFDFTIPDVPKVMAWGQQFLCVGFKAEYVLYDLSSGKPKELFPTSSSRSLEPTVAKYSETSFLLGREQTSVFVEEAKDSTIEIKQTIKWKEAPTCVVWDEPYILGLLQDKVIVQSVEPERFIQTLNEPNRARLMYRYVQDKVIVQSVEPERFIQTLNEPNRARLMYRYVQDKVIVQSVEPERFIQTLNEPNRARLMYRKSRKQNLQQENNIAIEVLKTKYFVELPT